MDRLSKSAIITKVLNEVCDCGQQDKHIEIADKILAALDKTEKELPETFMGYKIRDLQKVILFAQSRGFIVNKTEKECICKKPEYDTRERMVCVFCGRDIKLSPAKVPEKLDLGGVLNDQMARLTINKLIDWAKGVEEKP